MSRRIPKTMSSVETAGLFPLAPPGVGDRIRPKITPCNNCYNLVSGKWTIYPNRDRSFWTGAVRIQYK
jgi:hypothetical protein